MLTVQSYLTAMLIYWVAAMTGIVLMRRLWFATPNSLGGVTLGLIAGVLLAPAFPGPEVQSMAPALIVVVFNTLFGEGFESALSGVLWLLGGALSGAVAGFFWARRQARRTSL
jgi:hypothetical protein